MRLATVFIIALGLLCAALLLCALLDHALNWFVENTWVGRKLAKDLDEKEPPWWDPYEHEFRLTQYAWSIIYGALKWVADKIVAFIYWLAGIYESWGIPPPYSTYAAAGTPPAAAGIALLFVRWLAT